MNRNLTAEIFFKTIIIDGYRGRYFTLEIPQGHAVFLMDSNTGKTTVIELLRWCLFYPKSKAEGKYQHMWHNNAHVLDNEIDGEQEYFPFCCERCQLLDLYAWFNEEYYIPGEYYEEEE